MQCVRLFVESQDCTFMDDFCIKCNYGVLDLFELADGEAYTLAMVQKWVN